MIQIKRENEVRLLIVYKCFEWIETEYVTNLLGFGEGTQLRHLNVYSNVYTTI